MLFNGVSVSSVLCVVVLLSMVSASDESSSQWEDIVRENEVIQVSVGDTAIYQADPEVENQAMQPLDLLKMETIQRSNMDPKMSFDMLNWELGQMKPKVRLGEASEDHKKPSSMDTSLEEVPTSTSDPVTVPVADPVVVPTPVPVSSSVTIPVAPSPLEQPHNVKQNDKSQNSVYPTGSFATPLPPFLDKPFEEVPQLDVSNTHNYSSSSPRFKQGPQVRTNTVSLSNKASGFSFEWQFGILCTVIVAFVSLTAF